jgi:hypothetical protein
MGEKSTLVIRIAAKYRSSWGITFSSRTATLLLTTTYEQRNRLWYLETVALQLVILRPMHDRTRSASEILPLTLANSQGSSVSSGLIGRDARTPILIRGATMSTPTSQSTFA